MPLLVMAVQTQATMTFADHGYLNQGNIAFGGSGVFESGKHFVLGMRVF